MFAFQVLEAKGFGSAELDVVLTAPAKTLGLVVFANGFATVVFEGLLEGCANGLLFVVAAG